MLAQLEENYLSVVVTVHNEAGHILNSLDGLFVHLKRHFKNFEVIVVDNGSTDETAAILHGSDFNNLYIVELSRHYGVQNAITAGVELSIGDYVVEIPNLGLESISHKINELYRKSQEGFDFVFCVPCQTSFASGQFYKLLNKYFSNSLKMEISSSMMTLASRRGLNVVMAGQSRVINHNIAYVLSGLKCGRITIDQTYTNRRGFFNNLVLMLDTVLYYTDYVTRLIAMIAFCFLIFSLFCIGYGIDAFFFKDTMPGWLSLFMFVTLSFTGIFLILLILARQMNHMLSHSSRQKTYTYSSISKK